MPYSGRTPFYGLPFMRDGDILNEADEQSRAILLENLIRAAILAEGDTRVFKEGAYSTVINADDSVTVSLVGTPAVRGVARSGLVEVNGQVQWPNLQPGSRYYLYLQATRDTYFNPGLVTPIWDRAPKFTPDVLFLAVLDNTKRGEPTLDDKPSGKPFGANLFQILNDPTDPFGHQLTQTNLRVTSSFSVALSRHESASLKQVYRDASQPMIVFDNASEMPELFSSRELRLADARVPSGIALTDPDNAELRIPAKSLFGAINQILSPVKAVRRVVTLPVAPDELEPIRTDVRKSDFFSVLLTSHRYLMAPIGASDGQSITWRFIQDKFGGHRIRLDSIFRLGESVPSVELSAEPNKTDYIEAVYHGPAKKWDVVRFVKGY